MSFFDADENDVFNHIILKSYHFFSSRSVSPDLEEPGESVPLTFEDIVDKRTYDKMRPPRPGG